jgi:hypothetical protein
MWRLGIWTGDVDLVSHEREVVDGSAASEAGLRASAVQSSRRTAVSSGDGKGASCHDPLTLWYLFILSIPSHQTNKCVFYLLSHILLIKTKQLLYLLLC